jgi:hypothetical protein
MNFFGCCERKDERAWHCVSEQSRRREIRNWGPGSVVRPSAAKEYENWVCSSLSITFFESRPRNRSVN